MVLWEDVHLHDDVAGEITLQLLFTQLMSILLSAK